MHTAITHFTTTFSPFAGKSNSTVAVLEECLGVIWMVWYEEMLVLYRDIADTWINQVNVYPERDTK